MKRILTMTAAFIGLLGLTGCIEQASLINVKKDGSGTLKLRMYMSPQMSEGVGGLGTGGDGSLGGAMPYRFGAATTATTTGGWTWDNTRYAAGEGQEPIEQLLRLQLMIGAARFDQGDRPGQCAPIAGKDTFGQGLQGCGHDALNVRRPNWRRGRRRR